MYDSPEPTLRKVRGWVGCIVSEWELKFTQRTFPPLGNHVAENILLNVIFF